MHVVPVIQARMGSSRLPGKIMFPLGAKTILQHVVDAAKKIGCHEPYVATDYESLSQMHVDGASVFASHGLVSERFRKLYYELYDKDISYRDSLFVRLCGDQPFVDPKLVQPLVERIEGTGAKYAGYMVNGRPSALTAYGIYPEVFRASLMTVVEPSDHVTLPIYMRPDLYQCEWIEHEPGLFDTHNDVEFSLTVDSVLDYYRIKQWYEQGAIYIGGHPYKNDVRYDWL